MPEETAPVEAPAVEIVTVRIVKEQTHPSRFAGEVYGFPKPEADALIEAGDAELYTPTPA